MGRFCGAQARSLDTLLGSGDYVGHAAPALWPRRSENDTDLPMELLVCVINREEKLADILSGFLELGVTGATVISSEGMGRLVKKDLPVFAGLQTVLSGTRPHNTTIFSVIESKEKLEAAVKLIRDTCGDLGSPGTGIVFTVPVSQVVGLAPELGSERA
ncbi:MAG: hypothetical protein GTN62_08720 [Gemmatimonadales bacterium]|nr:hypothetical protein [Gemmatimonadales bacterium]NIN50179.1 hypothetical protein [Gemmatimonadales bacterium]NIP07643.1 hypothetical protein [Gemmatimonadales bacterium]NIR01795.1 hypothetical protein [Gemmatimonadales bacterium]